MKGDAQKPKEEWGHQASYTHGPGSACSKRGWENLSSSCPTQWVRKPGLTSSTSIREGLLEEGVDLKSYRARRGRGKGTRPEEQHSESSRQE